MGQLVFQATAGGQVALVGPNPSSNFSLNVPAVNGNLVTTGDTGTVTNTMISGPINATNGGTGVAGTLTGILYGNGTSAYTVATTAQALSLIGTVPVANGGTGSTTSTGSGSVVLQTSPSITTPTIDKINTSVTNTSLGAGNASLMKNRIINGAMVIDQRNAGASSTPSTNTYLVDRWSYVSSQASKFTWGQNLNSVTPPAGFRNYLGGQVASAVSVGSTDYFQLFQPIEGYNVADLGFGTANAKTVTLSFWVYSSLTGTFGGTLNNADTSRNYPYTYSIPVANTWTQISVTIAGDTTGTWNTTNGAGLYVRFGLGVGSTYSGTAGSWSSTLYVSATGATSVVGTSGATFYITGVQLEVGSSATGFEYRQYGQELALCQRYFVTTTEATAISNAAPGYVTITTRLNPVPMRATPSLSLGGTVTFNPFFNGSQFTTSTTPTLQRNVSDNFIINFSGFGSSGTGQIGEIYNNSINISAEL